MEDGDDFGGMTTLTFGTNEDQVRAGLTLFGRSGGFEYLLSGTRSDSGSYEHGSGVTVPGSEADLTSCATISGVKFSKSPSWAAERTDPASALSPLSALLPPSSLITDFANGWSIGRVALDMVPPPFSCDSRDIYLRPDSNYDAAM